MTLWRLEWLRLTRTRRVVALVGVYLFFGFLGPLTAKYLPEILSRFGGDIQVIIPEPVPADGIVQFSANAQQIGLLVALVVAAGALSIDAIPEMSVFLRTRVTGTWDLIRPRYVMTVLAVTGAFVLGVLAAWYETVVLLGRVSPGAMLLGTIYGAVYLCFAVALVGAIAAHAHSVVATVAIAIVVLLAFPIVGIIGAVKPWLPSELLGALDGLVRGGEAADYLRSLSITVTAIAGLLGLAVRATAAREL